MDSSSIHKVTGFNLTHAYSVPMPTQRAISPWSVNEYRQKLGCTAGIPVMH